MKEEKMPDKENVSAAEELIANLEAADTPAVGSPAEERVMTPAEGRPGENKIFRKFRIRDVVFLAVMAAVTLATGAIMPLVGQIPVFGIVQLCVGLQFSVFPTIGMMKVRKPFALIFMSLCCGVVLVFINAVMFFSILICAVIAEALVLLIFRGYKRDIACMLAGAVFFPCTLPFLYVWYNFFYTWTGGEGQAVSAYIGSGAGVAVGISLAALAVGLLGAFVGMIIAKELRKSGVMKK